jgi:uncharacterized delta-60 repeat protein
VTTVCHQPFIESLERLEPDTIEWRSILAGLLVLRLADTVREQGRSLIDADWAGVYSIRETVNSVNEGDPVRRVLSRLLDELGSPDYNARIVLTGESSGDRLGIARLTAAGALDPTFAGNGLLLTVPVGWTPVAPNEDHNVTVQADGRLVVSVNGGGTTAVGRLNADGSADTSFDGDGWRTFDFGSPSGVAHAVLVQPDGKIVVDGVVNVDGRALFALARFNPDGTFDDTP